MERLRRIIANRTVVALLHGSSIKTLQERVAELKEADFCYCSMNFFSIMETNILDQIDKKLSIVACFSEEEVPKRLEALDEFLSRPDDNLLLTTVQAVRDHPDFVLRHSEKMLYVAKPECPDRIAPNSAAGLFLSLVKSAATPRILLFGADGLLDTKVNIPDTYFGRETLARETRGWNLINDTILFNIRFAPTLERLYREHDLPRVEFLNCNPQSFLAPFPKVAFDHAVGLAGRAQSAVRAFRKALEETPGNVHSLLGLGDALLQLRETGEAETCYRTVLQVDRDNLAALDRLSKMYAEKAREVRRMRADAADRPPVSTPLLVESDYKGYNIVRVGENFYALKPEMGLLNPEQFPRRMFDHYFDKGMCIDADSLENVKQLLDILCFDPAAEPPRPAGGVRVEEQEDTPIIIAEDYKGFIIFAYDMHYYAVAHELGGMDFGQATPEQLRDYAERGLFFMADSYPEALAAVDGAARMPVEVGNRATE